MGIIPDMTRRQTRHPAWCDTSRCQAGRYSGKFGAHRSAPMTLGRVTVVLTQADHERRPSIEVRATSRLTPVAGDEGRGHALYAVMAVDAALEDCARLAQEWQNDHSMRDHTSRPTSTPNHTPGGDHR